MVRYLIVLATLLGALSGSNAQAQPVAPFEGPDRPPSPNAVDEAVFAALGARGITPAYPCSDEVFIRRVYLDVIGTLPEVPEVRAFLSDTNPAKRAALIDTLLQREEFADYWAMKWCDILRVKAEFPINLWPNAVQAYHHWIRDSIRQNKPYDVFARELLTSSGSCFRVPPVNFYRAVQGRKPTAIADAAALTFMGTRLDKWSPEQREQMSAFFSRLAYKQTGEWKEEIVCLDPAPAEPFDAVLPDGAKVHIDSDADPRELFAAWLISADNPWFARSAVNRVWAWLMGRGIVHEPDDFRADNPPSNPELLACLEKELVRSNYDLRHVYRLILNSGAYQQSSIPRSDAPEAEALFAYYPVRRLDAEVLIDALSQLFGVGEQYTSMIPEPFTYVPEESRTIALADGSITSSFLETFGRPARDSGLEAERNNQPTDAQRLYLLNSSHIRNKIRTSPRLRGLLQSSEGDRRGIVRTIYVAILSRPPMPEEIAAVEKYVDTSGVSGMDVAEDVVWALINTKEFQYRH